MKFKVNWDGLGIAASLACAIHCAVLPLLPISLSLFGMNIIHNLYFEWAMIFLAISIGTYALYHGYIRHHQSALPVSLFLTGCFFLIIKQFMHSYQLFLLWPAVIFIIAAHYINFRLCTRSKCSSPHHKH